MAMVISIRIELLQRKEIPSGMLIARIIEVSYPDPVQKRVQK